MADKILSGDDKRSLNGKRPLTAGFFYERPVSKNSYCCLQESGPSLGVTGRKGEEKKMSDRARTSSRNKGASQFFNPKT